jgi:hypothetical protein
MNADKNIIKLLYVVYLRLAGFDLPMDIYESSSAVMTNGSKNEPNMDLTQKMEAFITTRTEDLKTGNLTLFFFVGLSVYSDLYGSVVLIL